MHSWFRNGQKLLLSWGAYPRSGLARFTLWMAGLYLASQTLAWIIPASSKWQGTFSGWAVLFEFVLVVCALILMVRWIRRRVLWRLRNRLIVTYVFIGVIPVVLILTMAGVAGYILGNQLTTLMVHRDLLAEVDSLDTLNRTVALEIANDVQHESKGPLHLASLSPNGPVQNFPQWSIAATEGNRRIDIADAPSPAGDLGDPNRDLHGVVAFREGFLIRSTTSRTVGGHKLNVVIVVPLTPQLLGRAVADLGQITIYRLQQQSGSNGRVTVTFNDQKPGEKDQNYAPMATVRAGADPPPQNRTDPLLHFGSVFPTVDWAQGRTSRAFVKVDTRPSMLNRRVFTDLGEVGSAILAVLAVLAIAFSIIELIALFVGVRLTRTITGSIAQLYRATQHINRGDLKHRIDVRSNDQLASLEKSFNSMTESLERLLQEQKEKERLQNELTIAQEVQSQLFPRDIRRLASLELHGVCKPARTVSGDYYDFISLGDGRLGIAVGDISGKGISAALLMATIHSAVRVFELGSMPERGELVAAGAAVGGSRLRGVSSWRVAEEQMDSPAEVLQLLNRHLYQSTPPEKYATLFLGIYNEADRSFTFSNGGHLAPFVVHQSGAVRKLETGGLVIGLFPEIVLDQESVSMSPGDIFVAYSDGVTEPENDFGEFGEERLVDLVRSNRDLPLERISETVMTAVQDWIGNNEQPDDVTLVLARVR